MTKVLVLGASGMLGHKLIQRFASRFETHGSVHTSVSPWLSRLFTSESVSLHYADALDLGGIANTIAVVDPDVVVNAIGVVKQSENANDTERSMAINAHFPSRLADVCAEADCRLILISTDCVFSGDRGFYSETDAPDPVDTYGRTKLLGEVEGEQILTIRTSMIGRELLSSRGLIEWFLSNRGSEVRGFSRAIFSGLTTIALADLLADVIEKHPSLRGLYHVAGEPIDKYRLLMLVRDAYDADIKINEDSDVRIDRSLDGSRFRTMTGYVAEPWPVLIRGMAADQTPYDDLRRSCSA